MVGRKMVRIGMRILGRLIWRRGGGRRRGAASIWEKTCCKSQREVRACAVSAVATPLLHLHLLLSSSSPPPPPQLPLLTNSPPPPRDLLCSSVKSVASTTHPSQASSLPFPRFPPHPWEGEKMEGRKEEWEGGWREGSRWKGRKGSEMEGGRGADEKGVRWKGERGVRWQPSLSVGCSPCLSPRHPHRGSVVRREYDK